MKNELILIKKNIFLQLILRINKTIITPFMR